ncbi:hypothetical protein JTB14_027843 [Gonioctena quinquepunctata]|nr:hypothetical protein JTB14_027843 [Gonioctena quinquepunctata]
MPWKGKTQDCRPDNGGSGAGERRSVASAWWWDGHSIGRANGALFSGATKALISWDPPSSAADPPTKGPKDQPMETTVSVEDESTSAEGGERQPTVETCHTAFNKSVVHEVNFEDNMIENACIRTVGAASPTGWMTSEIFENWMHHFIKRARSSLQDPVLLSMDKHETHVSFEVIRLAKNSGVILSTLPPHTSHKLQPLDKCVYGPLKRYYNEASANVTDISESEQSTSTSEETENPHPTTTLGQIIPSTSTSSTCSSVAPEEVSSLKNNVPASNFVPPEVLRPYPKTSTEQNITKRGGRTKKSAKVLTSTPVMNILEEVTMEKMKQESSKRKRNMEKSNRKQKEKLIRQHIESTTESENEMLDSNASNDLSENYEDNSDTAIVVKSFVSVKFATKKNIKYLRFGIDLSGYDMI